MYTFVFHSLNDTNTAKRTDDTSLINHPTQKLGYFVKGNLCEEKFIRVHQPENTSNSFAMFCLFGTSTEYTAIYRHNRRRQVIRRSISFLLYGTEPV